MGKWRYRRLLRDAWHPPDEELLLYVEGEADARAARQVSDHLASCWTCRARRADIERAIGAYMAYHRDPAHESTAGGDDPEQATRRFSAALARARQRPPRDTSGRASSWSFVSAARVAALLAVIAIAARWWLAPAPVSARELIARVDRAQQQEIAAVADPVIYQRLHASRASARNTAAAGSDAVTWEVWSSQRQRRIVERVSASSPLLHDLQAVLRENGMEPGQPLSAASLTAWRRFAGHVAEDVRETRLADGVDAVALISSAPGAVQAGRIARSEIIVRTRDWHPVAHILTVAGAAGQQHRYTITELNYRVVPFTTVDATVFNPPAIAPSIDADEPAEDARPATTPAVPATHPARAALLALYEEHAAGACLREGGPDTALRHLSAIRQLAEWYRAARHDGLARGLDAGSRMTLASMIREHIEAARQHLPSSELAPVEDTAISASEPWTTVAMKAYAAGEYASRADAENAEDAENASTRQDAVARARGLLRSLEAAVQRFGQGTRPGAADAARGVTAPPHRP